MSQDEPCVLSIGTEVSAKYKGAFCEARIKKVNRILRLKISTQSSTPAITISENEIDSGRLKIGSTVTLKHPISQASGTNQGIVQKIIDQSTYTVVFDDGDEATLKRSSLCLKSGKHYSESESLDQLPLTHPEHFVHPVRNERRCRRNRHYASFNSKKACSTPQKNLNKSLNDIGSVNIENNNEDKIKFKTLSRPNKKTSKDSYVGKVVCVDYADKRGFKNKDIWFPAIVVSFSNNENLKSRESIAYKVRSFRDDRYYDVCKKDARLFEKQSISDSYKTKEYSQELQNAIEKALNYLNNSTFPNNWDDMDIQYEDAVDEVVNTQFEAKKYSIVENSDAAQSALDSDVESKNTAEENKDDDSNDAEDSCENNDSEIENIQEDGSIKSFDESIKPEEISSIEPSEGDGSEHHKSDNNKESISDDKNVNEDDQNDQDDENDSVDEDEDESNEDSDDDSDDDSDEDEDDDDDNDSDEDSEEELSDDDESDEDDEEIVEAIKLKSEIPSKVKVEEESKEEKFGEEGNRESKTLQKEEDESDEELYVDERNDEEESVSNDCEDDEYEFSDLESNDGDEEEDIVEKQRRLQKQSEERDMFVAKLYKFMDDRGTPINQCPSINGEEINLFRLYQIVHKMGGFNRVNNKNTWKIVYNRLGFKSTTDQLLASFNEPASGPTVPALPLSSTMMTASTIAASNIKKPDNNVKSILEGTGTPVQKLKTIYKTYLQPFHELNRKLGLAPVYLESRYPRAPSRPSRAERNRERSRLNSISSVASNQSATVRKNSQAQKQPSSNTSGPVKTIAIALMTGLKTEIPPRNPNFTCVSQSDEEDEKEFQKRILEEDDDPNKTVFQFYTKEIKVNFDIPEEKNSKTNEELERKKKEIAKNLYQVCVGDCLSVLYGKGKQMRIYDAKVMEIDINYSNRPSFYVHYYGWSNRYDEWIDIERITKIHRLKSTKRTWVKKLKNEKNAKRDSEGIGGIRTRKLSIKSESKDDEQLMSDNDENETKIKQEDLNEEDSVAPQTTTTIRRRTSSLSLKDLAPKNDFKSMKQGENDQNRRSSIKSSRCLEDDTDSKINDNNVYLEHKFIVNNEMDIEADEKSKTSNTGDVEVTSEDIVPQVSIGREVQKRKNETFSKTLDDNDPISKCIDENYEFTTKRLCVQPTTSKSCIISDFAKKSSSSSSSSLFSSSSSSPISASSLSSASPSSSSSSSSWSSLCNDNVQQSELLQENNEESNKSKLIDTRANTSDGSKSSPEEISDLKVSEEFPLSRDSNVMEDTGKFAKEEEFDRKSDISDKTPSTSIQNVVNECSESAALLVAIESIDDHDNSSKSINIDTFQNIKEEDIQSKTIECDESDDKLVEKESDISNKEENKGEEYENSLLLCEETVPASPISASPKPETASESINLSHLIENHDNSTSQTLKQSDTSTSVHQECNQNRPFSHFNQAANQNPKGTFELNSVANNKLLSSENKNESIDDEDDDDDDDLDDMDITAGNEADVDEFEDYNDRISSARRTRSLERKRRSNRANDNKSHSNLSSQESSQDGDDRAMDLIDNSKNITSINMKTLPSKRKCSTRLLLASNENDLIKTNRSRNNDDDDDDDDDDDGNSSSGSPNRCDKENSGKAFNSPALSPKKRRRGRIRTSSHSEVGKFESSTMSQANDALNSSTNSNSSSIRGCKTRGRNRSSNSNFNQPSNLDGSGLISTSNSFSGDTFQRNINNSIEFGISNSCQSSHNYNLSSHSNSISTNLVPPKPQPVDYDTMLNSYKPLSKYNFLLPIDLSLSSSEKCMILMNRMREMKKIYNEYKRKLSIIERKKKRLAKKQKEIDRRKETVNKKSSSVGAESNNQSNLNDSNHNSDSDNDSQSSSISRSRDQNDSIPSSKSSLTRTIVTKRTESSND
ncbi:AT-rich interactive domain-containing protein 4A [Sarcoptes scabiei]|uniref:AT-rich interactive domain-containing protein 4A n=1 Tax=Sarcoptes scabiei TaxID=52283 RepID=A0A834R1I5_SARSC|nr:AT-rich interactive domain-containing protein 4A [Sarcoptes scabiei]